MTINKSQQIRDYAAANPTAKAKEISTALGMKPTYVHTVLWTAKKPVAKKSAPKKGRPAPKKYQVKLKNVAPYVPMQIDMHEPKSDPVNHPAHYKVGGIETIDFIEAKRLNYNMGNAVKYITRADHKGSRKQDLEKAIWYLKREIEHSL
jgi:hypothetical protein